MKDNTFYFPHDYHAYNDPRCSALIKDFGMEGYGLYWCLVEIMHEQQDGKIKKFPELFEGLSYQLRIDKDKLTKQIEAMLHNYNLFQEDNKFIWSDRVLRNLAERKAKYEVKAEAGRIGGIKSGKVRKKRSKMKQCLKQTNKRKGKERKGKERRSTKRSLVATQTELQLSQFLLSKILERKSDYKKPNLQEWAKHIRDMIKIDNRNPEKIKQVIEWCQKDNFWRKNILSTKKLREKFDQLDINRIEDKKKEIEIEEKTERQKKKEKEEKLAFLDHKKIKGWDK